MQFKNYQKTDISFKYGFFTPSFLSTFEVTKHELLQID